MVVCTAWLQHADPQRTEGSTGCTTQHPASRIFLLPLQPSRLTFHQAVCVHRECSAAAEVAEAVASVPGKCKVTGHRQSGRGATHRPGSSDDTAPATLLAPALLVSTATTASAKGACNGKLVSDLGPDGPLWMFPRSPILAAQPSHGHNRLTIATTPFFGSLRGHTAGLTAGNGHPPPLL